MSVIWDHKKFWRVILILLTAEMWQDKCGLFLIGETEEKVLTQRGEN